MTEVLDSIRSANDEPSICYNRGSCPCCREVDLRTILASVVVDEYLCCVFGAVLDEDSSIFQKTGVRLGGLAQVVMCAG